MLYIHACCKHMFQVFHMFYTYIAYVCNDFQAFSQVFKTFVSSVSPIFFCMLKLLHLDVSKVNQVFAHGMHVRSGWRRGWRPRRCGPAAGALSREPDALGRSLTHCMGTIRTLAPSDRTSGRYQVRNQIALGSTLVVLLWGRYRGGYGCNCFGYLL
jgi:hypothetical protein